MKVTRKAVSVHDLVEPRAWCPDCKWPLYLTASSREPYCVQCKPPKKVNVEYDEHVSSITINLADGTRMDIYLPVASGASVGLCFYPPVNQGEYPHRSKVYYFDPKEELGNA